MEHTFNIDGLAVTVKVDRDEDGQPRVTLEPGEGTRLAGEMPGEYYLERTLTAEQTEALQLLEQMKDRETDPGAKGYTEGMQQRVRNGMNVDQRYLDQLKRGLAEMNPMGPCSDCGHEVLTTDGRCSDCHRVYVDALEAATEAWTEEHGEDSYDRAEAIACTSEGHLIGYFVTGYNGDGQPVWLANVVLNDDGTVTLDDLQEAAVRSTT